MNATTERTGSVLVDGLRIRYADTGADGPVILLTCPWPESLLAFRRIWPALDYPGARLWPELQDDVDRGLGDLPEPAEAGVVGQLPYRCGAGLGAERDPAGLGQGGRR